MNSWKVILATAVIFGAGVVTGGLLVNYVQHGRPPMHRNIQAESRRAPGQEPPLPRAEMMNKQFIQQLDDALQLAPDQRQAIEKIVADGQQRNRDLWKLVSPQMHMVIQDVNRQIRSKLTPEQQQQFLRLMKQLRPQRRLAATNAPPAMLPDTNLSDPPPVHLPAEAATNPPAR